MKALKSARIVAASLGVLAFGAMAASPAMAFDNVHWSWTKHVNEWVNIDACIHLNVDITGMVEVEKLQIFLGDSKATSTVYNIYNNPIRTEAKSTTPPPPPPKPPKHGGYDGPSVYGYNDKGKEHGGKDDYKDPHVKPVYLALDARYELPIVLSSAQAIGNNQSITSDVPVFLHDGQFVANVKDHNREAYWGNTDAMLAAVNGAGPSSIGPGGISHGPGGNSNTILAVLFGVGAVTHALTKSEIEAKSSVYNIHNASVDSSATAVANNINVDLQSSNANNHVLIADITQFALANVTATSTVNNVNADGYNHMRELTTATLQTSGTTLDIPVAVPTPWISSTATAVGNNVSINVGNPTHITGH